MRFWPFIGVILRRLICLFKLTLRASNSKISFTCFAKQSQGKWGGMGNFLTILGLKPMLKKEVLSFVREVTKMPITVRLEKDLVKISQ